MEGKSSFNTYLNAIGRVPLLTPAQEIELGRKIQRAESLKAEERELTPAEKREVRIGERATEKFMQANLRLVVNVAKKYARIAKSMDLMDLIQEGNVGLMTGVRRFDPSMGYKFSTYAYWWIRQAILRSVKYKDRMVRLPGTIGDMAYSWSTRVNQLTNELGRAPTREELAQSFKVTVEDLDLFRERGGHVGTLDKVMLDGDGSTLLDLVYDPEAEEAVMMERAVAEERLQRLHAAMYCLDERARSMVAKRYGIFGEEPQTLMQIGEANNVSRERARQIIDVSMRKIRVQMANMQARSVDNFAVRMA